MKLCTTFAVALLTLVGGLSATQAQTLYWDTNGATPGAGPGGANPDGTWGTTDSWSTDPDGAVPTGAWSPGADAVFAAGNDSVDQLVAVSGTQTANSVRIKDGIVYLNSGTVDSPTVTVDSGTSLRLIGAGRLGGGGKVVLDGGELFNYNPTTVFAMIPSSKGIEIDGTGYIGYDNSNSIPNDGVSIYSGVITGTGGTIDNGGRGTLVKVGPDQLGIGATTIGTDNSQSLFTFAKLEVREGSYRARALNGVVLETVFGAVPEAELPDAITLNGGGIGTNTTVTLSALRGITVGSNGGFFDTGATASINAPGPFSGSGTFSVTGTSGSGGFRLSHPNNVNTFSGNLVVDRGALFLDSSLTTPNLSGVSPAAGVAGTIQVAANMVLTAGSDNQNSSYVGRVTGAGIFTKEGTGTLSLDSLAEWTNVGGVNINAGSIKFGTSAAGFFTTSPIHVETGASLDMNGVNDTFGSLSGGGTVSMMGGAATPGNLTLGGGTTLGTKTFSGTISGGGNFTKGRALPGGAGDSLTQILTGNNTLGNVTVNAGKLLFNGTNTTGTVTVNGGATVAATLGGTGSVSGVVTVNSGGHIAPGASIESFDVGGLVLEAGSILDFELGAPGTSDLINVLNNNGLTLNGGSVVLTDAGGLAAGNYTLIDYAGLLGGSLANLGTPTGPGGFSYLLTDTGSTIDLTVTSVSATLIGDYNNDGMVNAADYTVWRDNLGAATLANGRDPANVGDVSQADYDSWYAHFGASAGSGAGVGATVPEPASLVLVGLAFAGLLGLARRTR